VRTDASLSKEEQQQETIRQTPTKPMRALSMVSPAASAGVSSNPLHLQLPQNIRHKRLSAKDAVALIHDGDTITVTGFVCQGVPEAILKAVGERYQETGHPNRLTLLFGGGPGDWDTRGLNHFAKMQPNSETASSQEPMLIRTLGGHYGQVPQVAQLALDEKIEAWTLPMGSVSRMIRAQATHSPGHVTSVGLGTYMDPDVGVGGAANNKALNSSFHKQLITKMSFFDGKEPMLLYKALPIHVAIIRGTTGDAQGNISCEQESLLCDQRISAAAAKNSGGIVIAQVKRMCQTGSLHPRNVTVPGALVDALVVVDGEDHDTLHPMSMVEVHNPAFTGTIKTPVDEIARMPLDCRKVIARRAFMGLKPDTIVNLGIGLPEGVASVASEEGMLDYVTLSTEPGVFGGLPAMGHSFGPAVNPAAHVEMNQMFDFYNGGGLDVCFLGAAQVSQRGDVNVSRMSKDRLTGPGGFIDISQSTQDIYFMCPLTAKGLEIALPGDGSFSVAKEGSVKKFVNEVFEVTFSGDEAVRRGQTVHYVTERAVFRRSAKHNVLELVEVAPGVDVQKDILDQMEFTPIISPDLKLMDARIFKDAPMEMTNEFFGTLEERFSYHEADHVVYCDLAGVTLNNEKDVNWFLSGLRALLDPITQQKGPVDMVINYNGFDLARGLENEYLEGVAKIQEEHYKSVKRYYGSAFRRSKLSKSLRIDEWNRDELFSQFDIDKNGILSVEELINGMKEKFNMILTPSQISEFLPDPNLPYIEKAAFDKALDCFLKYT
jgi:propionate CoA-transferase